jgi:two-component system, NtrC family, response regulator AtoC
MGTPAESLPQPLPLGRAQSCADHGPRPGRRANAPWHRTRDLRPTRPAVFSRRMSSEKETLRVAESSRQRPGRFRLSVLEKGGQHSSHALPESGSVSIGRSSATDVSIDDPSISRRHLVLHAGSVLQAQDLGSANGTRIRGQRLQPGEIIDIAPGDVIELGATLLVVQQDAAAPRPLRILTHDYFEARVQDEFDRSARTPACFALARVRTGPRSHEEVLDALAAAARPGDVVAQYGPGEYEILLVDTPPEVAGSWAGALSVALPGCSVGIACAPGEARTAAALLERSNSVAQGNAHPPEPAPPAPVLDHGGMERLRGLVERVAQSLINVLILGETGVGKGVLASEIHRRSPREGRPFVSVNCAALTESLLESELFGYEKGAFTGAVQAKPGLLETADGGTVFLDELGDMPLPLQAKVLRVIEDREVRRIGSVRARTIDVRFVSATNRDLEADAARGSFRSDLFFRVNGITLTVPPLRERVGEIEALSRAFVADAAHRSARTAPDITPEAAAALRRYPWPGNIRELRNVLERAVLLCGEGPITPEHLPEEKMRTTYYPQPKERAQPAAPASTAPPAPPTVPPPQLDPRELEKRRIVEALEKCAGNQSRAAKLLGISRRTLVARLGQYAIPRPRDKASSR